ncbi:MAG TPA: hypothetical protein VMS17_13640, partial [Gemmataceae bacterium]|nr:hypothetical protein [Gemmataceae bacterium]
AIYALEGDVLKICLASPEDPTRPTELATKEGGKSLLIVLKREKPDQPKPNEAQPKDDLTDKFTHLPKEVQAVLEQADQLDVYSLQPPNPPKEKPQVKDVFHEYKVLGKTTIKDAAVRKKLVEEIEKGVANGFGAAGCFNPRHGLRATHDGKTVDLVICFECTSIEIFNGTAQSFVWTGRGPQELFDKVLKDADVPLAPKPE